MKIAAEILLIVLAANGLRVTIGLPPVFYWFRSHTCPTCDGTGFVRDDEGADPDVR